jgi:hypothetical protein
MLVGWKQIYLQACFAVIVVSLDSQSLSVMEASPLHLIDDQEMKLVELICVTIAFAILIFLIRF